MPDQKSKSGRLGVLLFNSFANLIRAFSTSLTTILLPLILVFSMSTSAYAVWVVVFGVASYAIYLDLGLQATIQARVGRLYGHDVAGAHQVALSGLGLIAVVNGLFLLLLLVVAGVLGQIFPEIPSRLLLEAQVSLVILTAAQLANVSTNVVSAFYVGAQRSIEPALISSSARVLSLILTVAVASLTTNLIALACAFALPVFAGFVALLVRFFRERKVHRRPAEALAESQWWSLLKYSGPLIVWSVCMLIVNGLGVILVARFDYSAVPAYSIAMMFVAAIVGLDNAITAPLLSEFGRVDSLRGRDAMAYAVQTSTRWNTGLLFVLAACLILVAWPLLRAAPIESGQTGAFGVMVVAILASALRLCMTPLSMAFIATRTHMRVLWPPVVEAAANLAASVVLGSLLGVMGVALGALFGSVVGVALALGWSIRVAKLEEVSVWTLFSRGLLKPISLLTISLVASILVPFISPYPLLGTSLLTLPFVILGLVFFWTGSVNRAERRALLTILKRRGKSVKAQEWLLVPALLEK